MYCTREWKSCAGNKSCRACQHLTCTVVEAVKLLLRQSCGVFVLSAERCQSLVGQNVLSSVWCQSLVVKSIVKCVLDQSADNNLSIPQDPSSFQHKKVYQKQEEVLCFFIYCQTRNLVFVVGGPKQEMES